MREKVGKNCRPWKFLKCDREVMMKTRGCSNFSGSLGTVERIVLCEFRLNKMSVDSTKTRVNFETSLAHLSAARACLKRNT